MEQAVSGSGVADVAPVEQQDERTRERLLRAAVLRVRPEGLRGSVGPRNRGDGRASPSPPSTTTSAARSASSRRCWRRRAASSRAPSTRRFSARARRASGCSRSAATSTVSSRRTCRPSASPTRCSSARSRARLRSTSRSSTGRSNRAVSQIVAEGQAAGEIVRAASPSDVALVIMGIIGVFAMRQLHQDVPPLGLDTMNRVFGLVFDGALGEQRQQGEQGQ